MDFDFIEDEGQRSQAVEAYNTSVQTINDGVAAQIEEAIGGLKTKNEELLDEKKQIQKTLKNFDDIDADKARDALAFLEGNDDAQLIKDGKIDELIDKRTSNMKSDHETAVGELQTTLKEAVDSGSMYKSLYENKMVDDALREASVGAKVLNEAVSDVLLRGRDVFTLAADGSVEARDSEGKLMKTGDDKVLTTSNWIEGLKKSSPHYWPGSSGAGAQSGGKGGDASDITAALGRAADSGDMVEFNRLRKKQTQG